ncbi:GNAT family N-acetyltransferase [Aspergillus mulundensis]|uniref:N-acetyltransferase domain-containing protein n=1 Tax=Aspergillus mulundensis TaxID=1810919 RepID=A0A3D8RFB5_9EURO|nr:hypothetical protein DSM5745_07911 [Aspergillus mulundensis]RDW72739.1 hypothetical protein DSM5745_07911 [Aspergillus mulundensis]
MSPTTSAMVTLPPATTPTATTLTGRTIKLVPLTPAHADELFPLVNNAHPHQTALWEWVPVGPFADLPDLRSTLAAAISSDDTLLFAILDSRPNLNTTGKAIGFISYMAISPSNLRLEIGHVIFTKPLQGTTGATEAVYLLLKHAIEDLGFRRVEWKCHSANEASMRAAIRFGFKYEGLFRQHMVVKGRNRDTVYYAILRDEWAVLKKGFEGWLDVENFDQAGVQNKKLEEFHRAAQRALGLL